MATIRKRGEKWQAIVDRKGVYKSKSFPSKAEALKWSKEVEGDVVETSFRKRQSMTFGDLLDQYGREYSGAKPTGGKEVQFFDRVKRDFPALAAVELDDLTPTHFKRWKDARLAAGASPGTVLRERGPLSAALRYAVDELGLISSSPLKAVKMPEPPEPREAHYTHDMIEAITSAAGYSYTTPPATRDARVGALFLFALETAMRCKEMCILRWDYVNLKDRTVTVPKKHVTHTKTGGRDVPLTTEAVRILKQMEKVKGDSVLVFNLDSNEASSRFLALRMMAGVKDRTLHDAKHEACTRLAKHMPIQDLARMVGTRNLSTLMIYFNPKAKDIAKNLP